MITKKRDGQFVLFAIVLIIMLLPHTASAYDFMFDGLCYNINSDGTSVTVTYKSGSWISGNITIPESVTYGGTTYSVTAIGYSAFSCCSELTSVTIPNSVTSIDESAFENCNSLTSVTIPNSVTSIGDHAFIGCSGLKSITIGNKVESIGKFAFQDCRSLISITIPNSVSTIGGSAFRYCNLLTSVTIGNSVTIIDNQAFRDCSRLTSVSIPNSVDSIGWSAFQDCSEITSVSIGNSVTSIGYQAFSGCSSMERIVVVSGNKNYDSRNDCNAIIETETNTLITGCKNTIIPNSVTSIGQRAFQGCTGLTSVTIPNSVTAIDYCAFIYCSGLTSVTIPNSVTSIGQAAFQGCSGLTSIAIPNSVTYIGGGAFSGCSSMERIVVVSGNAKYDSRKDCNAIIETETNTLINGCKNTIIPNTVTSIGGSAFSGCNGLTSVTIPNSVTSIGMYAFNSCSGLTTISVPISVIQIGRYAFHYTPWFNNQPDGVVYAGKVAYTYKGTMPPNTNITINSNCHAITDYCFYNLKNLTSVTIPNSIKFIWQYAFYGCSGLTNVTIPNSVASIGQYAFNRCSGLNSIIIGNSVTSIGDYAFFGCSGLTSVTIPNSVTSIGLWAFNSCSGLTTISIPNSVIQIGRRAFDNTPWFNNQPDGVVYAGKVAYTYKGTMPPNTNITINSNCHAITDYCFYDLKNLTSVTIPNSIKFIGQYAFWGCSGLTSVAIPSSVTSIGNRAFLNCSNINRVDITDLKAWCEIDFYNAYSNPLYHGKSLYLNGQKAHDLSILEGTAHVGSFAFFNCEGLTSVSIPNSVTSIGWSAFNGCSGLSSVNIPYNINSISSYAFYHCNKLSMIDSEIDYPTNIAMGEYIFDGVPNESCTLYVPDGSTSEYQSTSPWNEFNIVAKVMRLRADTIHYVRGMNNTVVELPIELLNYKSISGLQFDMQLGTNMTFNLRNGMPDVWLEDSRKARNHTVAVERQSESSEQYRVLVSSQTSLPLKGTSGVLIHANMQINKYGTAGLFPIRYSNITMAAPDETPFYQDAWSSYLSYEYFVGDANADAQVNVGDFGVTANKILGRDVTSLYFSDAANVNQDYVVDVVDLVGIANISLGIRPQEIRRSPAIHNAQFIIHNQSSLLANVVDNQMSIALDNAVAIAGLQMDVTLPHGVTISDARLQGRAAGHDLQMATLPDGRVRLLVASFSDKDIAAGDSEILTLTLSGNANGMVTVSDIVAAERNLTGHELDEVRVPLGTTGIDGMASYNEVRIYAQDGKIVIESPTNGSAQLVMLNGITRPLKVQAGRNVYPAEPGFYIVRMAGVTAKIKN